MPDLDLRARIKEMLVKNLMLQTTPDQIGDDLPLFGPNGLGLDSIDALELVVSAIAKADAGTGDEISHGTRDPDGRWFGQRGDAGGDVHRDTGDVVASKLDLAGMDAASHFDAELVRGVADRTCAFDGAGRPVERRDEAVAGGVYFPAPIARQLPTDQGVVTVQQFAPSTVAEFMRPLG